MTRSSYETQAQFQQRPMPSPISRPMQVPTPDDVLTALSAFPAPPNHIPASPAASIATASSYFSLPARDEREGKEGKDAPPSAFGARQMRTMGTGGGEKRRDSVVSVQSAQSGKLSVLVNGRDVEYDSRTEWDERDWNGKRDSGSGSSARSGVSSAFGKGMGGGGSLSSPSSERFYYTAPSTPLPPGTPGAGPSSCVSPAGSLGSLGTYPHSPCSSSFPYAYSTDYPYTYTNPVSAYAPSSARMALAMLSTSTSPATVSATSLSSSNSASSSTSGSPASMRVPTSAIGAGTGAGMSPIEEREEGPRGGALSRQLSSCQQQNVIGGPPSVPLPPIPSTPRSKFNSIYTDSSDSTPTQSSHIAPSVKSIPSLRSARPRRSAYSNMQGQGHAQRESVASVMSARSGMSGFSSVAPSLAEFGVARRVDLGMKDMNDEENSGENRWSLESTIEAGDMTLGRTGSGEGEREGMRRTPRAGAPLRIDIPPPYAQEKERIRIQQTQQLQKRNAVVSIASSYSDLEHEKDEVGTKVQSPTASLFSVGSGMTSRSAMSSAQSLRTRVSGMLDGLGKTPEPVPSTSVGKEEENGQYTKGTELRPGASSTSLSSGASADVSGTSATNNLLTAEDLTRDPLLARAVTPTTPLDNSSVARGTNPSHSPLEMSNMYNVMRSGAESPLTVPSLVQVPPLSDTDTDGNESDLPGTEAKLSPGILGQFPSTPTMSARPPPCSFPFPGPSSRLSLAAAGTGPAGESTTSNSAAILRTMSQSRRKPLPPAPRPLHTSLSSVSLVSSRKDTGRQASSSRSRALISPNRGKSQSGRGNYDDGATSPDIVSMMCSTPRPISRSKSMSARSSLSTGSPSSRSSSVKRYTRNHARPSLPDERERDAALARFSAYSISSSKTPSRSSSKVRNGLSTRQTYGSEYSTAYGGVEGVDDDDDVDPDASMDYGIAIARHRGGYDLSPSLVGVNEALEADELDGLRTATDGGEFYAEEAQAMLGDSSPEHAEDESDSDIDLHTPLPHILLREGVLHPHSKVLASSGSTSVRSSFMGTGRDSVLSNDTHASFGSSMTKSGLFKDARNTEGRRRRHRDGKTLREGLGLTTGLGWSDSEDEDAPSAFTNRLTAMDLSRNTSMSSFRSLSSKRSQFISRSTPAPALTSRNASTSSGHPNLNSSRSSRVLMHEGTTHPLTKFPSTANLSGQERGFTKRTPVKSLNDESRSMSPTSSSSASLPFPPTPRDDLYDDPDASTLSGLMVRKASSRASSIRAKTPTANSVKTSQSASQLRTRVVSGPKSAPPSRLPSFGMSTPRPLRLPALQLQHKETSSKSQVEDQRQPGQSTLRSGTLLGYNRNLHDRQRAQHLTASSSNPASPPSPLSPALSAQSAPSSCLSYPSQGPYGSIPIVSALRPPATSMARAREPSPSRLSTPETGIGKPRTGTGMVYRQSSLPPARVGSIVGRPAVI